MSNRGHIPALQSLRGLAALVVLLHHASFVFATSPGFRSALETALNAHAAVVIFFVLSGFVLSRSLGDAPLNRRGVMRFWLRRGFRIYPAAWAACVLAIILMTVLADVPTRNASDWFGAMLSLARLDASNIITNLIVLKTTLVPPLWSVRMELAMSLLMPLIWGLVRRGFAVPLLVVTGTLCLASVHPLLAYVFAFALGSTLARHDSLSPTPLAALAAVLVLLFFRRLNPAWHFETDYEAAIPTFVESLAGVVVVAFVAQDRVPRWLVAAPLVALGDISYSLYALHFPILAALSKLPFLGNLAPDIAALLLMALTLAVTLPAAALAYRWIERPGIALGKRLLARSPPPMPA